MRAPLSPARIVTAAVQVADAGGLNAVSMRSVARALEVEAMSLYHHVRNKAALVEALVEWIYQNLKPRLPLLSMVVVHETCTAGSRYCGPDAD